jgi:hypothetical protein
MNGQLHITNRKAYCVLLIATGIFPVTSLLLLFIGGLDILWLTLPIFLGSLIFYQDMITNYFMIIQLEDQLITVKKTLLKYHLWKKKKNNELLIPTDDWDELAIGYMKNTKFYCLKKDHELVYFFYAIGMEAFEKAVRTHFHHKKVSTYGTEPPTKELKQRSPDSVLE